MEAPHFIVGQKPTDATQVYADLASATAAANTQAEAAVGTEIYVYEARESALVPPQAPQDSDLGPQT